MTGCSGGGKIRMETRMEQMMEFMKGLDWSPLLISLKTGVVATILSFFGGIYAARQVVKAGPKTKAVMDGILTLPMVLPPTVAGFFLLLIFSWCCVVWKFWNQGGTDLAWLYSGGNGNCFSTDVPECQSRF